MVKTPNRLFLPDYLTPAPTGFRVCCLPGSTPSGGVSAFKPPRARRAKATRAPSLCKAPRPCGHSHKALTSSRQVDIIPPMKTKNNSATKSLQPRKIIGLSLPPHVAAAVKLEAARRNITLRDLFMELWALHRNRKSGVTSNVR